MRGFGPNNKLKVGPAQCKFMKLEPGSPGRDLDLAGCLRAGGGDAPQGHLAVFSLHSQQGYNLIDQSLVP